MNDNITAGTVSTYHSRSSISVKATNRWFARYALFPLVVFWTLQSVLSSIFTLVIELRKERRGVVFPFWE